MGFYIWWLVNKDNGESIDFCSKKEAKEYAISHNIKRYKIKRESMM